MYSPDVVDLIKKLPRLQELRLFGVDVSYGSKWTKLMCLSTLNSVAFSWWPGRDALEALVALPRLVSLRLTGVTTALSAEFLLLTQLTGLTDLTLSLPVRWGSPEASVPRRFFGALSSLTRLEIGLNAPHMLDALTAILDLQELSLSAPNVITDRYSLPLLTSLLKLEIQSCECRTPSFFESICAQTRLTQLRLSFLQVHVKPPSLLHSLVRLRALHLLKSALPADTLSHISKLTSLETLEILDPLSQSRWISSEGIMAFRCLTNMRRLHVSSFATAEVLRLIPHMPLLHTVTLPAGPEQRLISKLYAYLRVWKLCEEAEF